MVSAASLVEKSPMHTCVVMPWSCSCFSSPYSDQKSASSGWSSQTLQMSPKSCTGRTTYVSNPLKFFSFLISSDHSADDCGWRSRYRSMSSCVRVRRRGFLVFAWEVWVSMLIHLPVLAVRLALLRTSDSSLSDTKLCCGTFLHGTYAWGPRTKCLSVVFLLS